MMHEWSTMKRLIYLRGNPATGGGGGSPLTVTGATPLLMPGAVSKPLRKAEFAISPVQSGSGDPSPSNVRAITGWTAANCYVTGHNIWDEEWEVGSFSTVDGTNIATTNQIRAKNLMPVAPGEQYCFVSPYGVWTMFFDAKKNVIVPPSGAYATANNCIQIAGNYSKFVNMPSNCAYIRFYCQQVYGTTYNHDISINYPSTFTTYTPYSGSSLSVEFPASVGTVYGGTIDPVTGEGVVTGVLEKFNRTFGNGIASDIGISSMSINSGGVQALGNDITRIGFNIDGDRSKYNLVSSGYTNKLCNMAPHYFTYNSETVHWYRNTVLYVFLPTSLVGTTAESVVNYLTSIKDTTPLSVWCELADPIPFTVPPQSLTPPAGDAYIWADCGSSAEVTYIGKP